MGTFRTALALHTFVFQHLRAAVLLPLAITAALFTSSCARPGRYDTPAETVSAMRNAIKDDKSLDFIGALSTGTRDRYETIAQAAWSDVRAAFMPLAGKAELVEVEDHAWMERIQSAPNGYVWPPQDKPLKKATMLIEFDGRVYTEHFLFIQETKEANDKEFLTWLAVYPYFPFQGYSELGRNMAEKLEQQRSAAGGK